MRYVPGAGVRLNRKVVNAATAANAQPLNTATVETYTGTLAGGAAGSTVALILNGVTYAQDYDTSAANSADLLATACASGTYDKWFFSVSGGNAAGTETITVTIPGDTGGNTGTGVWTYNPVAGRTNTQMAGDLRTLINTTFPSTKYTAGGGGAGVSLTKNLRGVGVTISTTADGALSATISHSIVGVAGQSAWTVSALAGALTIAHATAGVTTDTVSRTVSGTFTLTLTESIIGGDVLAAGSGVPLFGVLAANGSVVALLNAGTTYELEIWNRFAGVGWQKDGTFGTKTVAANTAYSFAIQGLETYAYVKTFVGGASATVTITTTT